MSEIGGDDVETTTGDEIDSIEKLGEVLGTPDEPPSLYECFSDSRSLRTGKFEFRLRSESR